MYKVIKAIEFCYGHRLLHYEGKCRHLHGHNASVEIELASEELDERGMVYDFSEIKQTVKKWIDDNIDHVMLLNKDDDIIPLLEESGERYLSVDGNPTAEFIAKMIYEQVESFGFPVTTVRVSETPDSHAEYSK
ncbi:MAG: 6-carboxytetrahydropterin synthase QueD [Candidatus Marinimicrobia bacterium]|nr:6-carboxytetrahydropterin synthase QueD [Candidatus Neomarinimicrobiota bacterium]MCH7619777.1 6-carboxytetrahydropterin synthase QueD [Candidatus Neomarinimicrobiota bacterium]MCH8288410.1 6-carboxytetrahydropterin synthase QueD [Candidatus Neomarinimicrobiota bacterium]